MSAPSWLEAVLESCHGKCLDNAAERVEIAEAIIAAFPREQLVKELFTTVRNRLAKDGDTAFAMPIARNCAAAVEALLLEPASP